MNPDVTMGGIVFLVSFFIVVQAAAGELSPLVVGGVVSPYGKHPYICTLQIFAAGFWRHSCGSIIFDQHHVITAAHCVDESSTPMRIQCGKHSLLSTDLHEVTINIQQCTVHEEWQPNGDGFPNDIAVCRTETTIPFGDYIRPLDIDSGMWGNWAGVECELTGWGITATGSPANFLKEVNMTALSNEACEEAYGSIYGATIYPYHICLKGQIGQDACSQDSGGPARCYSGDRWVAVAVTSWGMVPCDGTYPAVSIRLSSFYFWILQHTSAD